MRAEQLMEMATEYEKVVKQVKGGELTVAELKEALDYALEQVEQVIDLTTKVLNGEEVEGIGSIQRVAIMAQIEEEKINFDYKEQKRVVTTILQMVQKMDEEIGEDIFNSFIINMFNLTIPMLEIVQPDAAKAIRKGIKKHKKLTEKGE